jgi:hypothetical protein
MKASHALETNETHSSKAPLFLVENKSSSLQGKACSPLGYLNSFPRATVNRGGIVRIITFSNLGLSRVFEESTLFSIPEVNERTPGRGTHDAGQGDTPRGLQLGLKNRWVAADVWECFVAFRQH